MTEFARMLYADTGYSSYDVREGNRLAGELEDRLGAWLSRITAPEWISLKECSGSWV
jgi:hypothetical protein